MDIENFEKQLEDYANRLERSAQERQEQQLVSRIKKHQALNEELQKTRQELLRYLVATSGMIFSILIGLGKSEAHQPLARWGFAIAIVLLGLGVLLLSIALYSLLYIRRKIVERYAKVLEKAYTTHHPAEKIHQVREPRFFALCEKVGLVCLALAVIALMVSVVAQYGL